MVVEGGDELVRVGGGRRGRRPRRARAGRRRRSRSATAARSSPRPSISPTASTRSELGTVTGRSSGTTLPSRRPAAKRPGQEGHEELPQALAGAVADRAEHAPVADGVAGRRTRWRRASGTWTPGAGASSATASAASSPRPRYSFRNGFDAGDRHHQPVARASGPPGRLPAASAKQELSSGRQATAGGGWRRRAGGPSCSTSRSQVPRLERRVTEAERPAPRPARRFGSVTTSVPPRPHPVAQAGGRPCRSGVSSDWKTIWSVGVGQAADV